MAGAVAVRGPSPGELPPEQTVWTIAAPSGVGPGVPEGATPLAEPAGEPQVRGLLPFRLRDADSGKGCSAENVERIPLGCPSASDTAALWRWSLDDPHTVLHCAVAGRANLLTVRYDQARDTWARRWLAAALLLALWAGLGVLWRRGFVPGWFGQWPLVLGIAGGLAWWLWCWPSSLGLVIVMGTLVRRLQTRKKRIEQPQISQMHADSVQNNA